MLSLLGIDVTPSYQNKKFSEQVGGLTVAMALTASGSLMCGTCSSTGSWPTSLILMTDEEGVEPGVEPAALYMFTCWFR